MRCSFVSFVVASVVVFVVVACPAPPSIAVGNGEGEGESDGEDDAVPATRYCEELAPIFCPFYLRCGRMAVDDEAACRVAFAESCEAAFEPRFTPLAAAGLLQLTQAGLDACAAHISASSCDEQLLELSGPCAQVWQGNVAAGGACGLDADSFVCAPGTFCALDLSLCGVCEVVRELGTACDDDASACGPAGFCDGGVCVARGAVGDACSDDSVPCVLPARCDGAVCREPAVVAVGDACDFAQRCPYRSRCDDVCVATAGHGGSCATDDDCDAGFCDGGVCVAVFAAGDACVDDVECAAGCADDVCQEFTSACVR